MQDVLKTSWKTKNCYAEGVLKTSSRHVLKAPWRPINVCWVGSYRVLGPHGVPGGPGVLGSVFPLCRTGLLSEGAEALHAELNERAETATSSYSALGNFPQYIYSVLVAKIIRRSDQGV